MSVQFAWNTQLQLRFDLLIAFSQLRADKVEGGQRLLKREQVLD
ncbi:MAG: hypothetical protein QG660_922, partial [Pseudomonadota bacterium]|nr:hypothetical protein [Pseudomonadota bacterium]